MLLLRAHDTFVTVLKFRCHANRYTHMREDFEMAREDGEHAVEWLVKSIDNGYFEASSVLGMAYVTGKAKVKIQRDKGIKPLNDAAESADTQAQQML
jgi:TPR repeat protein